MKTTLLFACILFAGILRTTAQPGTLDPSFGTGGHVVLPRSFTATAFEADGKLVGIVTEGGNIVIERFNSNGSPDPSFGAGGRVTADLGSASDQAFSVAIAPDGKIVVLGSTVVSAGGPPNNFLVLLRYNSNGSPDPSFGEEGMVRENIGQANVRLLLTPQGVAIKNNGEIVVAIQTRISSGSGIEYYIELRGFDVTGTSNLTASLSGTVNENYTVTSIQIQPDDKIVISGSKETITRVPVTSTATNLLVFRFNPNGTNDASFGTNGEFTSNISDTAISTTLQADNKILVSATGNKLLRLNSNGTVDPSFGTGGVVTTAFRVNRLLVDSEGKIIAGGSLGGNFAVARYNSNGTPDESFGSAGMVTSDFGTNEGIENMSIVGDRLYAYGSGILAAYLLTTPTVTPIESNTASGNGALSSNTTGSLNTATGFQALASNTTGSANTAYGAAALPGNITGNGNTGIGYNSLYLNSTGYNNTATGGAALGLNATGSNNVAFGVGAGFNNNNFSSTFIGTLSDAATPVTNSTALGFQTIVTASNQVRIGNSAVNSIGGFTNWTNLSDGRFKKNINEDVPGLTFINRLRPVTYTIDVDGIDKKLKTSSVKREGEAGKSITVLPPSAEELTAKANKANVKYTGFVAQEVEQAAKKLNYEFSGVDVPASKNGYYGLRYAEFVVPLVKAVQELDAENKQLRDEVNELKNMVTKILSNQGANINPNNGNVHLSGAYLEQNLPNPFSSSTIIRYHIPQSVGNAQIVITSLKGQTLKNIVVSKGDGQVTLHAGSLSAGNYVCSLSINGKTVDSKQITIVR